MPVTYNNTNVQPPVVTASDLEIVAGDAVPGIALANGVEAESGVTASKFNNYDGTYNGTVTLTNDGGLTGPDAAVGYYTQTLEAEDLTDNTKATTTRNITVKAANLPELDIYYAGTTTPYDGEWLSQDASADTERQQAVDIVASTKEPGNFDLSLYQNGAEMVPPQFTTFTGNTLGNEVTHTLPGYATESATDAGEAFNSILLANGDHTITLSELSNEGKVKIDSTIPTVSLTTGNNWATMDAASTDALSGVAHTYANFVSAGDTAPAMTDSGWTEVTSNTATNLVPGYYDIYAYAVDNATNKSAVTPVATNVLISSSDPAVLTATYEDDDNVTQNYTSDTWINKDITVTVDKPTGFTSNINWYGAIYEGTPEGPSPDYKGGADSSVSNTYSADIPSPGTTVRGYVVDAADTKLSGASPEMILKIDKQLPVGNVSLNAGTWDFTDLSTDQANLSGVDGTKTQVAVMPYGTTPTSSAYESITTAELPATGWYDVWVIATDHAGNKSIPVKALEHVSRSLMDEIHAKDFAYDIAAGSASLSDDMAKMLSHVEAIYQGGGDVPLANIDVDPTEMAAIKSAIDAGQSGTTWPLTFRTQGATSGSVTIDVTLFDRGSVPNPPPGPLTHELIYGNNFSYGMDNGAISNEAAKNHANVAAFKANGDPIATSDITVDATQLQVINDAIEAGDKSGNPFPLTFYTPDNTAVTVDVTLKDHGNEPDPGDDVITANDFEYGLDEPDLTDLVAKILSQVEAKDGNGAAIPVANIAVDGAELAAINAAIAADDKSGNPFPLTFTTPGGAAVTVKVTLKDHGAGDPSSNTDHIVGNDFFYGLNQPAIDDTLSKILANVSAVDGSGNALDLTTINVNATELQAINDAIAADDKSGNPFPLTFSTPDSTSVTVQVTLYDNGDGPETPGPDGERIAANDFSYGVDQIAITDAMSKVLAEVIAAYPGGKDMALSDVTVDADELAAINAAIEGDVIGKYPLSFTTPGGAKADITVTLKNHGNPNLDPDTPVITADQITANDFGYGVDEPDVTDDIAKLLSDVEAKDASGNPIDWSNISVDATELAAINANKNAGILGENPLTFTTSGGTSVTITVTLKNHGAGTVDPVSGTDHIVGNDFAYGVDQGAIDTEDAKVYASVEARDKNGLPIPLGSLTTDAATLQVINDAIAAGDLGEYPLTFYTPDNTAVTVKVTLKDNGGGTVDPDAPKNNTERIAGNGFIYGIDEGDLGEDVAKFRSQVVAVDKKGNPIAIADIITDADELSAINDAIEAGKTGDYPLTYSTADGTSTTVTVTLKKRAVKPDEDPSNEDKTSTGNIGGNDFEYNTESEDPMTPADAIERGKVIAKDVFGNDVDPDDITVDQDQLNAINDAEEGGVFPLTYTSPEGKSVTVYVTVYKNATITAQDFSHEIDKGAITEAQAKTYAAAAATDRFGKEYTEADISTDKKELAAINKSIAAGELKAFPLTFTSKDEKSVTVEVTLLDSTPDPNQAVTPAANTNVSNRNTAYAKAGISRANVKTGDNTAIFTLVVMLMLASVVITGTVTVLKRKKQS